MTWSTTIAHSYKTALLYMLKAVSGSFYEQPELVTNQIEIFHGLLQQIFSHRNSGTE